MRLVTLALALATASPLPAASLLPAAAAQTGADTAATAPRTLRVLVEVRAAGTGEPLPGARVAVDSLVRVADADGRVVVTGLTPGPVGIGAALLGYAPADTTVVLARSARIAFELQTASLGTVEVEAERFNAERLRRSGFYERAQTRSGVFLDEADVEARRTPQAADLLRGLPGLRVETRLGQTSVRSTRRRRCTPAVFVDGTEARGLGDALDTLPAESVLAVEVYRGPSEVPAAFSVMGPGEACGAILFWTRAR